MLHRVCIVFLLLVATPALAEKSPLVVVTIKPLYALAASIMGETGTPTLLVAGANSLHDYQLKPSQMATLKNAQLVFYLDKSFETFLRRAFATLPKGKGAKRVALAHEPGLSFLDLRSGGAWEAHAHHDKTHHHARQDMHLWLDPDNAAILVRAITRELSEAYPENAPTYAKNETALLARLAAQDAKLKARLAPLKDKPYIVFHDAYQYIERRYGLMGIGSITLDPHESPSPARLKAIREKIRETNAVCVFRELQFHDGLVNTVTEGLKVQSATLDPEGVSLPPSPELYFTMMDDLAKGFEACL